MNVVEIGEPIGVLAAFSGGGVEPLKFRWGPKAYGVEAINGKWIDRAGPGPTLHFSVQVAAETYYIHFDSAETQWWLDQVITE